MINVTDELKEAVITEAMPKKMEVTITNTDNLQVLNWYSEEYHGSRYYDLDLAPGDSTKLLNFFRFDVEGAINYDYVDQADWVGISYDLEVSNIDPDSSGSFAPRLVYYSHGQLVNSTFGTIYLSSIPTTVRYGQRVSAIDFERFDAFRIINTDSTKNLKCRLTFRKPKLYMYAGNSTSVAAYSDIFATETNVARYVALGTYGNDHIISQSFSFRESICSDERMRLGLAESSSIEIGLFDVPKIPVGCDVDVSLHIGEAEEGFEWKNFVVAESKKESRGGIGACYLTAYDRNSRLSQNAYSWYTKYMWGMNLDSPQPNEQYKFDYCRQMYGALRNLINSFGIEKPSQYDANHFQSDTFVPAENLTQDRYFNYTSESYVTYKRIAFCKMTITRNADCNVVGFDCRNQAATGYWNLMDKFYRGILNNACVYIDFHVGNDTIRILADSLDLIAIPPECETFDVYVPYAFCDNSFNIPANGIFTSSVSVIQRINTYYDVDTIVNGYRQLPYFSYKDPKPTVDDIIAVDSSITIRDIVRSVCEMCGCFFRLDRNGNPTFLYASEHGLYPSNTLFPANDLFPQKSGEMTMPTSYYIKAEFAEYQVSNYGGVQVVVNTSGNTGGVCRWEYWTDEDNDNAYIIDDNIFLCADGLNNDPTQMADILTILENMYGCLDNLQYTPFSAETIGTPFLESGDRFTLLTQNDGFESFIFERKLKGIQALKDYFEARGIQKTPRVRNFEWQ